MLKLLKIIAYPLLAIGWLYGSFVATSYLSRWTADDPLENVPYICYVAVDTVDNETKFIRFKELMETPMPQQSISTKQTINKKEGYDFWQLTTESNIKTVHYAGDDYESWFRYRFNNQQIEPLSCRVQGIGTGLLAWLLTILLLVLIPFLKIFVNIYRRFQFRKMS